MIETPIKIPILTGPTAGGKSQLALDWAERNDGILINADAMQLYRPLRIITARPLPETVARVPHRLDGILEPEQAANAAWWCKQVMDLIAENFAQSLSNQSRPKPMMIIGGTGLYIKALTEGLAEIPTVNEEIRAAATLRYDSIGGAAMRQEIFAFDPIIAQKIRPSDRQRLIRAWEVYHGTGFSLSHWHSQPPKPLLASKSPRQIPPPEFQIMVLAPPRESLVQRINNRTLQMVEAGVIEEVATVAHHDRKLPMMKALGVSIILDHLNGEISIDQAIEKLQKNTRNYAKRQMTWFRHQFTAVNWLPETVKRLDFRDSRFM